MNPKIGLIQWERAQMPEIRSDIRTINLAVSDDGGICLSRMQQAIADARRDCNLVWIAAGGVAAAAAIAAAEQLMVDRLLICGDPFSDTPAGMRRINAFARRNLSLIAAEAFLIGAEERCARRLAQRMGRRVANAGAAQIWELGDLSDKRLYAVDALVNFAHRC